MTPKEELEALRKQKRLVELEAKAARAPPRPAAQPQPAYNPTEGNSFGRNAVEGYGARTVGLGRRLAHALAPEGMRYQEGRLAPTNDGSIPPDKFYSKEAIAEQDRLDAPLNATAGGKIGGFTADFVNTLPAAAVGKGAQIVGKAAESGPAVVRALGRALGSRAGQAGVEGFTVGKATADPENDQAVKSAVLGSTLSLLGKTGGRLTRGLVKPSAEAEMLQTVAAQHGMDPELPLSQYADSSGLSGMVKKGYNTFLPLIPGAPNALKRGEDNAANKFRELSLREAAPAGTVLPDAPGTHIHDSMSAIGNAFEKEFKDTIKSYSFNVPAQGDFATYVKSKLPNIDSTTLANVSDAAEGIIKRYSSGGKVLDGDNLIRAKTELARLGREAVDERTGQALQHTQEMLDDVVRNELKQGSVPQNLADLERYEALETPWKNFTRVQGAAAKASAPKGEFTAKELKSSVLKRSTERQLARGEAPMQDIADIGMSTVGQGNRYPGFLEKAAAWGLTGGAGILGSPLASAGLIAGARTAASQPAQKALTGRLASQKAIADLLRRYPETATLLGTGARGAAVRQFGEEDASQQ